jgi:hypothetical protein
LSTESTGWRFLREINAQRGCGTEIDGVERFRIDKGIESRLASAPEKRDDEINGDDSTMSRHSESMKKMK